MDKLQKTNMNYLFCFNKKLLTRFVEDVDKKLGKYGFVECILCYFDM
jgi:hypothetical protein